MQECIINAVKFNLRKRPVVILKKHYGSKSTSKKKLAEPLKGAVVLSGCGHLDGTCICEAMAVAVNLYKGGVVPQFYAPKNLQADVFNHQTECPAKEERCAIVESARIARGKIQDICQLRYCDASCLVVPGGFGVAKTLTTFDQDRANCSIDGEVMRVLEEFHDARKPMGFTCIAGILPARLFPFVKVTLGMKGKPDLWPYQYAIDCACQMGAELEAREVDGYSFDKQHMVFTTPAFLYNGNLAQIYDGITIMIQNLCKYVE